MSWPGGSGPGPTIPSDQPAFQNPTASNHGGGAIQIGVPAALANLTQVVTAAQRQGTADREAKDLLHQADDLANALQQRHKDDKRKNALKKLVQLERKIEELLGKGKIRPPATTQIREAIAEPAQAVQDAG
jgi:hypothetical protein